MKKLLTSVLIFIIVLTAFVGYSNAADATIKFAPSSSNIIVGNEFEAVLSLQDLGPFTDGINSAGGVLSYDSNYVQFVSMSAKGSWILQLFNQDSGKFLLLTPNMDPVGTGAMVSIKFKLIAKPSQTTKVATLSEVSITDGLTDEIAFNPVHITINASDPAPVNNTVTNTPVNNTVTNTPVNNTVTNTPINNAIIVPPVNNTVANNTINNTVSNIVLRPTNNTTQNNKVNTNVPITNTGDSTTAPIRLPNAGFNTIIIISTIGTLVSGIFGYFRYKNIDK